MKKFIALCMVFAMVFSPIVVSNSYATVSTATSTITYSGDNTTTVFPYPFQIFDDTDIVVTSTVASTGVETTKTITTDYTVSGAGDASGGNVTMATSPTTLQTLTIQRVMPLTQGLDLVDNTSTSVENYEDAFDKLTMITQQLAEVNDRTVVAGVSSTEDLVLPIPVASRAIGWNVTADGLANIEIPGQTDQSLFSYDSPTFASITLTNAPTSGQDAATKAYTDAAIGAVGGAELVTSTGSTTARSLAIRFSEVTNVKDFGAVGDGVTDDTTAFTGAINSAVDNGKVLYCPEGDYALTTWSAMTLTDSFHIVGDGRDVVTITGKDTSTTNFVNLSETGSLYVEGIKFSTFNSVFDRRLQASTDIPYIRIAKCEFKDVSYSIYLNAASDTHDDNLVTNIEIFDNEVDTALRGFNCTMLVKHAIVSNNYIHDLVSSTATVDGIKMGRDVSTTTPVDHVLQGSYIITDNTIETIQGPGGASSERVAGILAFGARVVISNNVLQDISLTTPGTDNACNGIYTKARNVVIDGNVLYDVQGYDAAIRVKGGGVGDDPSTAHRSHNYVISNNSIWFDPAETTQLEQAIDINVSGRCAIVGNYIENVNFRGIKVAASNAATGSIGAEDVIIANNVISNQLGVSSTAAEGIELRDFVNATISGNIINMEATYAKLYYGIYIRKTGATYPTAKNLMINNNVINLTDPSGEANTVYGIAIDQAQANAMKNVNVRDNIISLVSATRAVRCIGFFNDTSLAEVVTIMGNDWSQSSGTSTTFVYKTATTTPTALIIKDNYPNPLVALADDATPSVSYGTWFTTGGATTITDFDDGLEGKIITVVAAHSLDITDGTHIFLSGSANWSMTATDSLTLLCQADGTWVEISRGDNGA